ncbi:MAG: hypothetical protein EBT45_08815 [Alphaproteobacteria bacterium]|nr:hypothetical protein [Alphaproteobacteria bacterium]
MIQDDRCSVDALYGCPPFFGRAIFADQRLKIKAIIAVSVFTSDDVADQECLGSPVGVHI